MAKSTKKSTSKVDAAPALAPQTKSTKKGKREVESREEPASVKKHKKDVVAEQTCEKQNDKSEIQEDETSTSEDVSPSDSEEERQAKVKLATMYGILSRRLDKESSHDDSPSNEDPTVKTLSHSKKQSVTAAKNSITGAIANKGKLSGSSDSSEDTHAKENEDHKSKGKQTNSAGLTSQPNKLPATSAAKAGSVSILKKEKSNENLGEGSLLDVEDENHVKVSSQKTKKLPISSPKIAPGAASRHVAEKSQRTVISDSGEGEPQKKGDLDDNSEERDNDESRRKKTTSIPDDGKQNANAGHTGNGSDEGSSAESSGIERRKPKGPETSEVQTTGSKTIFVGNLSFSIEKTDVEEFFKDVGEIVEIRFGIDDGIFRGFCHIDFATVEAAQKAFKLDGQSLLGRRVKLDFAREKGSYTPSGGEERNSYHQGTRARGRTVFVRGFDKGHGENKIRSTLEEHFGSCGDIWKLSIPKDNAGGVKGIAYINFKDGYAFNKALDLNGSELGNSTLTVEEAKGRGDYGDRGGRSFGRYGAAQFGSRRRDGQYGGSRNTRHG